MPDTPAGESTHLPLLGNLAPCAPFPRGGWGKETNPTRRRRERGALAPGPECEPRATVVFISSCAALTCPLKKKENASFLPQTCVLPLQAPPLTPCAPHRQSRTCLSTEESPGHPEHPHELGSGAGQGTQVLRLLRPVSVWHTAPRANPARFRLATGARLRLAVTHQGPAQRPQQSTNRTEPPVSGAGAETAPSLPGGVQPAFATSGGSGDTRVRKAVTQSCPWHRVRGSRPRV